MEAQLNKPYPVTLAEHRRVIDLVFSQMPAMQNRASSTWWFFLLFPEGPEGFGPRQLMFTIATRAGERIRINDVWLKGLDPQRTVSDGCDAFEAMAVGWYCDGAHVHDEFIRVAGRAELDARAGTLCCGDNAPGGQSMTFRRSAARDVGLEAVVRGAGGDADFEVWGALDSLNASPSVTIDVATPLGGTHYIGWRRLSFRGRFRLPAGVEALQGIGFFQRVCLNVPVFPWKWIWAVFPDESVFTAYVPYIGPQLFRKGYRFFSSSRREATTLPVIQSATWIPSGNAAPTVFKRMTARPVLGRGPHPQFEIDARNRAGDRIRFTAAPYGLSRFYIDRPILGGRLESHWNYNEYMFRVENLDGVLNGRALSRETLGQGFGSLEYTYGLGL